VGRHRLLVGLLLFPSVYLSHPPCHGVLLSVTGKGLCSARNESRMFRPELLVGEYAERRFQGSSWRNRATSFFR
jgi:hypothetical protein